MKWNWIMMYKIVWIDFLSEAAFQIIVMRLNTFAETFMDSLHFDDEEEDCLKTHIARVWKDLCIQFMVMHVSLIWFIVMQKIVRTRCTSLKDSLVRFIVILEIVWIHFTSAGAFIDSKIDWIRFTSPESFIDSVHCVSGDWLNSLLRTIAFFHCSSTTTSRSTEFKGK